MGGHRPGSYVANGSVGPGHGNGEIEGSRTGEGPMSLLIVLYYMFLRMIEKIGNGAV